ncbi:uncharacterized protein isoform X2 [Rhodnius prolixus]|uniref:uncharacterized protein isoform X2 n=1 Tax=Rhodnius prolixus TaxID=13249 RepID=UPI003D18A39E
MITLLFSYIFILASISSVHTEKLEFRVFRCIVEVKENCTLLQGPTNETSRHANIQVYPAVPDDILNIYIRQERNVQNALDSGRLNLLSKNELCSMSPTMLMLIPSPHFSSIRAEYIAAAINCWQENLAIVRKLMKSVSLSSDMDWFFISLQNYELPDSVLKVVAEYVVININSNLEVLIGDKFSILEHLGPSNVLSHVSLKILEQLRNTKFSPWFLNSKAIRIWSYAMVFYEYPLPLNKWNDNLTKRMEKMLVGVTSDDLRLLNLNLIRNKLDLLRMNFSILQIRTLYNYIFEKQKPNKIECKSLEFLQVKLLPEQIQQCLSTTFDLSRIAMPESIHSMFSAKQIVLYHMRKENLSPNYLNQSNLLYINKFVFTLAPDILDNSLNKSSITLSTLVQLQSPLLTEIQAFYLTSRGRAITLHSPLIYECYELLQVISAAQITEVTLPSNIYYHLLSNMPANNLPRSVIILNKIWTDLASETNFRELLYNPDATALVGLLPSKYIRNFSEIFIQSIYNLKINYSSAISNLPEGFLSILFEEARGTLFNKNYKISHYIFIGGLSCNHILTSNAGEFIVLIAQYNRYLRETGKDFPKNLQSCAVRKLYEYLEMKSLLLQHYISESIISYLTESDIEAVGGYVLTSLPVEDLVTSENIEDIVRAIGRCSLSELMVAASKEKLRNIAKSYMEVYGSTDYSLFNLGNLTLFLPEYFMKDINSRDFKLMLESGYLDRRTCANSNERKAIASLVKTTFGDIKTWTPQSLVTLGDMLLIVADELHLIENRFLMQAADLITLNYHQLMDWPKPSPFFETCARKLEKAENELFIQSLQKLVSWLLDGLIMQENSIIFPKPVELLYDKAIFQNVSLLDVHIETRKVIGNSEDNSLENSGYSSTLVGTLSDVAPSQVDSTTIAAQSEYSVQESSSNKDNVTINYHGNGNSFQDTKSNSSTEHFKDINGILVSTQIYISELNKIRGETEEANIFTSPYEKENVHTTLSRSSITEDYKDVFQKSTERELIIKDVDRLTFINTSTLQPTVYNSATNENISEMISTTSFKDKVKSSWTESFLEDPTVSTLFLNFTSQYYNTNLSSSYTPDLLTTTEETFIDFQNIDKNSTHTISDLSSTFDIHIPEITTIDALQGSENQFQSKGFSNNSEERQTSSVQLNNFINHSHNEKVAESAIKTTKQIFKNKLKKLFRFISKPKPAVISYNESTANTSPTKIPSFSVVNNTDSETINDFFDFSTPSFSTSTLEVVSPVTITVPQDIEINKFHVKEESNSSEVVVSNSTQNDKETELTTKTTTGLLFNDKVKKLFKIFSKTKPSFITLESTNETRTEMNSYSDQENINSAILPNESFGDITHENSSKGRSTVVTSEKNLNASDIPIAIQNNRRSILRRSISRKITCAQIRILGNIIEIIVTEDFITMMSDEELNNCVDMFGQMNLSRTLQMLIWKRIQKLEFHLLGKLVGAAQITDIKRLDLNLTKPWILESLHILGMYGSKPAKLYLANEIGKTAFPLNLESVVSLGPLMCHLLPLSKFLSPEIFLQSSKILGKILTCNPQCLDKMIRIAMNEKAFGSIENWTAADVNTLGVIIAGLSTDELYEMFTNNFKALSEISAEAMECIVKYRQQALRFIKKDTIYSLPPSAAFVLNQTAFNSLDDLQKYDLTKYLSEPSYNEFTSEKSISVRAERYILIIYFFIVGFTILL